MENNGAANTERALVLHNSKKIVKISSLYIDFTMYGPLPTESNNEVRDVAALKQSESSPKSSEMKDKEVADILLQLSNDSSKNPEIAAKTGLPEIAAKTGLPEIAAKTGLPEVPKYVSLRDLIEEKEKLRKNQKAEKEIFKL